MFLVYVFGFVDHANFGEPVGSVSFYGVGKGRSEEEPFRNRRIYVSRYGVGFIRNADRGQPLGFLTTKGEEKSGESRGGGEWKASRTWVDFASITEQPAARAFIWFHWKRFRSAVV